MAGPRNYTLGQIAQQPALMQSQPISPAQPAGPAFDPNRGAQFLNGNSFDFVGGANSAYDPEFLRQLQQFDPNAWMENVQYGEGGNTNDVRYHFDPAKMPKPAKSVSTDPRNPFAGLAGLPLGNDGQVNNSGLFNGKAYVKDPTYGYITPVNNVKSRMIDDKAGPIAMALFSMALGGFGALSGLSPLARAAMSLPSMAGSIANKNWAGAALSALGAGVGAYGGMQGWNPNLTSAGTTLGKIAVGQALRRGR